MAAAFEHSSMLSNPSISTIETPVSSIPATSVSPIPSTSFIPASSFNSATPGNNSVLLDAFLPRSQINRTPPPSPTAPSLARRKPRFVASFSAPRTRSNPNFVPTELVKDPARKTWARFQNLRSKIDRTPSLLERLSRFTVKTEGSATQICHFHFLSPSAYLFTYFYFRFSFSFFLAFWTFLFSYFLTHLPLYPHPFRTFYLSWKSAWHQISLYYLPPSRTSRKYRYVTPPHLSFSFQLLSFSLSYS